MGGLRRHLVARNALQELWRRGDEAVGERQGDGADRLRPLVGHPAPVGRAADAQRGVEGDHVGERHRQSASPDPDGIVAEETVQVAELRGAASEAEHGREDPACAAGLHFDHACFFPEDLRAGEGLRQQAAQDGAVAPLVGAADRGPRAASRALVRFRAGGFARALLIAPVDERPLSGGDGEAQVLGRALMEAFDQAAREAVAVISVQRRHEQRGHRRGVALGEGGHDREAGRDLARELRLRPRVIPAVEDLLRGGQAHRLRHRAPTSVRGVPAVRPPR